MTSILFYVQHLLGIGHLARASRIASALGEGGFDVTMVTGGTPVAGFPPPVVKHVQLPAMTSSDLGFSDLIDEHGASVDDGFRSRRRDLLLQAFRDTRPDILVTEAFPFGRRQVRFELLPLLEAATSGSRRPVIAASIRDILQSRAKPGRDRETADLVARFYDLVLVHGDPAFARLDETFPLVAEFADKVRYTGLVAGDRPTRSGERHDVVVSAGGGAAGEALVRAAIDAAKRLDPTLDWLLITGPNLPQPTFDDIVAGAPDNLKIERFRKDFASLLVTTRVSVSQAGYNTVGDILQANCRSVLVPFVAGGETEQTVRAERLAERGLASIVTEAELSGEALATAVDAQLGQGAPPVHGLELDGAQRTAKLLRHISG